jgi:hypothetical protein
LRRIAGPREPGPPAPIGPTVTIVSKVVD